MGRPAGGHHRHRGGAGGDRGFGLGFSDALAACFDPILDLVSEELQAAGAPPALDLTDLSEAPAVEPDPPAPEVWEPTEAMVALVGYAHRHAEARAQSARAPALIDPLDLEAAGVVLTGRVRPWGVGVKAGGDWFDAVPLAGGLVAVVVGNVAGRGVDAAPAMSDLRAAARAYAVLDGGAPAQVVERLDLLAGVTGAAQGTRLLYLTVDPRTGEVRSVSAGSPPALLVSGRRARYLDTEPGEPLGAGSHRAEGRFRLDAGDTLLLCTDGLLENPTLPRAAGLERLRRAAMAAPAPDTDTLVDHVLAACTGDLRRDDDVCLVGLHLLG